jgi:predicted transcriptional regulator
MKNKKKKWITFKMKNINNKELITIKRILQENNIQYVMSEGLFLTLIEEDFNKLKELTTFVELGKLRFVGAFYM